MKKYVFFVTSFLFLNFNLMARSENFSDSTYLVRQARALEKIYKHWRIPFNPKTSIELWPGVFGKVDQGKRVLVLNLSHRGLLGSIPVELADLTALQELKLSYNHLTGLVPVSLGKLIHLRKLSLEKNRLKEVDKFREYMKRKNPSCDLELNQR